MQISSRWICGKYVEVTVSDGSATIVSSPITPAEASDLAAQLAEVVDDLRRCERGAGLEFV